MKTQNILNVVASLVFCALASITRGQSCQNGCGAVNTDTFLGVNALVNETGGGYTDNTAIGGYALSDNNAGSNNTAVGYASLVSNTGGGWNTAVGVFALNQNTSGESNTAVGAFTLQSPTSASNNTATGYSALGSDTTGNDNTADGYQALYFNTTGTKNTATGRGALYNNTTASNNVAIGYQALNKNKTGTGNVATGYQALNKSTASYNTATGSSALAATTTGTANLGEGYDAMFTNTTGSDNTAIGYDALYFNATGGGNIAVGADAGFNITGNNNIDIANEGIAGESSVTRIGSTQTSAYMAGIYGATASGGVTVYVDSNGHLGTITSSARFKEKIKPMDKTSEVLLSLEPVTFRYKKELDPKSIPQFGLVAEQVEKVGPDLVAKDNDGKPYSVRYEAVNAMLLNEFLKEHKAFVEEQRKVQEQGATIARLEQQIQALTSGLQKVSDQLEASKPAPQVVSNP